MWSLLFISIGAQSQTCPMYNCHEGGFDISPTCGALTQNNNILLQLCENPGALYCDVTGTITNNYTCVSSPPYSKPLAYPGEYCVENSDCITSTCTANTCVGQQAGYSCNSNSDCDVGNFCGPGFYCTPQLSYHQSCTNDFQCQNNMACNRTLFQPGVCIFYYSIPVGSPVGTCIDMLTEGVSNLCATGSCILTDDPYDTVGICANATYTPTKNYPRVCMSDADCLGIDGNGNFTNGTCSCGMDSAGRAFCDSFAGDPPAQTVQLLWLLHTGSTTINNCHTQRRFDVWCLSQNLGTSQVQNFLSNRALATDTARYQGNDFCTKEIFNAQFFNLSPSNYVCQAYGCANNTVNWQNGTCITLTQASNSFSIVNCPINGTYPYCDYTKSVNNQWRNVTCGPAPTVLIHYAGESCTGNATCMTSNCVNGICVGTQLGGSCVETQECDVGLYCKSTGFQFTCQPLIQPFNFGCGSDFECVNYAGCVYTSQGPPGMCIPYFNATIGTNVPCSNGNSLVCSTGACYASSNGYTGQCTVAPVSKTPLGTPCTMSGQCAGNNTLGQSFYGTCTCGYNNQSLSYCTPFMGDAPGVNYLKEMKKIYNSTSPINKCQTTRRFSLDCFGSVTTKLNRLMLNYTNLPYYIGNDDCVKYTYNNAFWNITIPVPPTPHPSKPSILPPPFPPGTTPPENNIIIVTNKTKYTGSLVLVASLLAFIL